MRRPPGRARPIAAHRLAGERLVLQPRHPVDRVLETAGDGEIIFRRAEDHAIRGADGIGEGVHRRRKAGRVLDVGIVERKLGKGRRRLDRHALRRQRRQRALHDGVEGALAQRAADRKNVQCGHGGVSSTGEKAARSSRGGFDVPAVAAGCLVQELQIQAAQLTQALLPDAGGSDCYFSFSIGFESTPTPSMSISQVSPCLIHTGLGLRAWPTPEGVPVSRVSART